LVTCPEAGDNSSKGLLIPHELCEVRGGRGKDTEVFVLGGACGPSASW
jgi:hypothetical protein